LLLGLCATIVAISIATVRPRWLVAKPRGADVKRRSKTPNQVCGRALTEIRTTAHLSQATLAANLGYSTYYLGRIERGDANISCDVMAAVSAYFEMSIGQFWIYAEKLSQSSFMRK
jgi:DNA-binding XRE family transcriptional regulator